MSSTTFNFKEFKEFLADECSEIKKYKEGKYDRKIFNWFAQKFYDKLKEIYVSEG